MTLYWFRLFGDSPVSVKDEVFAVMVVTIESRVILNPVSLLIVSCHSNLIDDDVRTVVVSDDIAEGTFAVVKCAGALDAVSVPFLIFCCYPPVIRSVR